MLKNDGHLHLHLGRYPLPIIGLNRIVSGSLTTHHFQLDARSGSRRDVGKGSARAHVHMYPTVSM